MATHKSEPDAPESTRESAKAVLAFWIRERALDQADRAAASKLVAAYVAACVREDRAAQHRSKHESAFMEMARALNLVDKRR